MLTMGFHASCASGRSPHFIRSFIKWINNALRTAAIKFELLITCIEAGKTFPIILSSEGGITFCQHLQNMYKYKYIYSCQTHSKFLYNNVVMYMMHKACSVQHALRTALVAPSPPPPTGPQPYPRHRRNRWLFQGSQPTLPHTINSIIDQNQLINKHWLHASSVRQRQTLPCGDLKTLHNAANGRTNR